MSARYKFRTLQKHLEKKPFTKEGYRFEKSGRGYVSYEMFNQGRQTNFIAKRLGLRVVGKPSFLMTIFDGEFEPTLLGIRLYHKDKHHRYWRCMRYREKVSDVIKQQKEADYWHLMQENSRKIEAIHTIFYRKW